MKIEAVKKIVAFADERKLSYIVTTDNEHHYFGNSNGFELIWDDVNELLIQITTNQEPGIVSKGIMAEAQIGAYEHIQGCRILLDRKSTIDFYNDYVETSELTDEKKKNVMDFIQYMASNISYPKPGSGQGSR